MILETQQNSDTTYRVYDYDRTDNSGNKRELHVQKSIDVTNVPHINFDTDYKIVSTSDFKCTTFVSNEFFSVYKLDVLENVILHTIHLFLYTVCWMEMENLYTIL